MQRGIEACPFRSSERTSPRATRGRDSDEEQRDRLRRCQRILERLLHHVLICLHIGRGFNNPYLRPIIVAPHGAKMERCGSRRPIRGLKFLDLPPSVSIRHNTKQSGSSMSTAATVKHHYVVRTIPLATCSGDPATIVPFVLKQLGNAEYTCSYFSATAEQLGINSPVCPPEKPHIKAVPNMRRCPEIPTSLSQVLRATHTMSAHCSV